MAPKPDKTGGAFQPTPAVNANAVGLRVFLPQSLRYASVYHALRASYGKLSVVMARLESGGTS